MANVIRSLPDRDDDESVIARGRDVVTLESDALRLLAVSLDAEFVGACRRIFACHNRLIVTGMGKSGHIARKIAATFAATGTPALFIHPAEAAHGDLGMVVEGDVLIVISNSGNTTELRPLIEYARRKHVVVIGMSSQPKSLVMKLSDVRLRLPSMREACMANIAPTTSTVMQLAMGDALAIAVMEMRGSTADSLRSLHPGGMIGSRLTPVRDIMHDVTALPIVGPETRIPEVISTMTTGGFGIAGVVTSDGSLAGVITDGDLRRHFAELDVADAGTIMTPQPKTIGAGMTLEDALILLNAAKITAAFVIEENQGSSTTRPIGIVHIHDFLRSGMS